MKHHVSIPGVSFSFISTTLYLFTLAAVIVRGPNLILANNIIAAFLGLLLIIIFLPFLILMFIMGIIACVLMLIGTILSIAGKGKVGGIFIIVGAGIGFFFSIVLAFTPLISGIIGGAIILIKEHER